MSLDDDFSRLNVSSEGRQHADMQLLDRHSHNINTDELSFTRAKTSKDKANRATVENVLDPRTMRFLRSLMNRGVISDFNGCLSTGKEANVYHAFAGDDEQQAGHEKQELAIKIYKTSILVFKDRERYVDGEFRFRNSRSQHNPRKMIKIWAEKEFRNLRRIYQSGVIPTPKPIEVKNNVLVMEFLSRGDGFASPRLKDYVFVDRSEICHYYYVMLAYIRLLYQVCRLVHADLSEYNAIIHEGKLYIIDVSQSVEPEHPMSLDFLRMDIKNVNSYFEKLGIGIFPERLIFQFVISERLDKFDGDYRSYYDLSDYVSKNLPIKSSAKDADEDEIFRSLHLVRSLEGLEERDFDRFTDGKFDLLKSLIAHDNERNFSAIKDISGSHEASEASESETDLEDEDSEGEDELATSDDEDDKEDEDDKHKKPKGKKFEDKEEKKKRKQEVKESKKEKRQIKVKKHIKKKLIKKTKSKK
ncbi:hypothetical protein HG537_0E00970 [Torulaspora globosa]|uniref:Serine/threonine-protein kinase RIO1 n=1 Tax=Torulaspora globosa TaxID=48254 RepID=A0A7H9HSN4_9SACH|nr:hypothetical protein HG537_0E00970 [Torulaspora sp. CBS 2947]